MPVGVVYALVEFLILTPDLLDGGGLAVLDRLGTALAQCLTHGVQPDKEIVFALVAFPAVTVAFSFLYRTG